MADSFNASQNQFAFKLFGALIQHAPDRNTFTSPVSVALALGMTAVGARGSTARAIADVLGVSDLRPEALDSAYGELIGSLATVERDIVLQIANSLWVRSGTELRAEFFQRIRENYGAEAHDIAFDSSALATINRWVSDHTGGKVPTILDRLPPAAMLVLLNALYFKGGWSRPFDRRLTRDGPFTLANGRTKQLPMMAQSGNYEYFESRDLQGVVLPYGSGRLRMYIFLPATRTGLAAFLRSLDARGWNELLRGFRKTDGQISLPRFTATYETSLNEPLSALGMREAFGSDANFSGMCAERVHIDEVRHKTVVDVNEEGAEAAAATSVTIMRTSFAPKRTFSLNIDRPFFCTISDQQTGALLFMGAIFDPQ